MAGLFYGNFLIFVKVLWRPNSFVFGNPLMHIELDGMDWYEDDHGNLLWQDGSDETVTHNDVSYRNIGTSYSYQMADGSFMNFYQNQAVSTSAQAVNAEKTILGDPGLFGQMMGKDSPLSENSQAGLMQAAIHQGQAGFWDEASRTALFQAAMFVATGGIEGLVSLGGLFSGGAKAGARSVDDVAGQIKNWLGKDAKAITNKAGDNVFISKDGMRRVRFDINNPSPHTSPHSHVEQFVNGKWVKSGPLYPKNALQH